MGGIMSLKPRVIMKSDGRITIPEEIRKQLSLKEGTVMELEVYGQNKILITILVR